MSRRILAVDFTKVEKRDLTRALGLGYVIIIVISNMLGSGVFKKIAPGQIQKGSDAMRPLAMRSDDDQSCYDL